MVGPHSGAPLRGTGRSRPAGAAPTTPARFEGSSMHHPTSRPPLHRRRRRLLRLLLATVALTLATAASAQAASITVDQDCIERGDPSTGLGFVSGSFTGAPTGPQYYT